MPTHPVHDPFPIGLPYCLSLMSFVSTVRFRAAAMTFSLRVRFPMGRPVG